MKYIKLLLLLVFCTTLHTSCRRPLVVKKREGEIIDFEFKNKSSVQEEVRKEEDPRVALNDEHFNPFYLERKDYKISKGDVLEISIFGDDDQAMRETVVAPDGRIYYMFADAIPAEGRTLKDVANDIESKIGHLFTNPEVTVIPRQIMAQRYMILGKVARPGIYPILSSLTLRHAIGEAGGVAYGGYAGTTIQIASLRDSFIVRNGKKLDINFANLLFTEGSEYDVYVQPGDYIYLASSLVRQIYLIGAVREQKPIPYKDGLTLFKAVSGPSGLVGGVLLGGPFAANVSQIMIVRGSLKQPKVMMVDLFKIIEGQARDVYLEPGDIVYIPNKKFRFGRGLVRSAIDTFVSTFGSDVGNYYASEEWFKSGP